MDDGHTAVIPHTLSQRAQATLSSAVGDRVPELEVATPRTPDDTIAALESASIAISMHMRESWYDHLDRLEWIQGLSAGYDHFDLDRLEDAGIRMTNASGVHATPIAEQVMSYLLAFERDLLQAMANKRRGVWERYTGGELGDRTLGIVGLGAIGSAVAHHGARFDMEIVASTRTPSEAPDVVDAVHPPSELDTVLATAEYLVVAVPLTPETRGLLDADAFRVLPDDAVVVNVARGGVIVEADLIHALKQGRIGGAALDVFEEEPLPDDSPLWNLSNVIITPHMAGSTPHYWERCADIFGTNYDRFTRGRPEEMRNVVL